MQTKKRKMKEGEALVGMKRRGSQLLRDLSVLWCCFLCSAGPDLPA